MSDLQRCPRDVLVLILDSANNLKDASSLGQSCKACWESFRLCAWSLQQELIVKQKQILYRLRPQAQIKMAMRQLKQDRQIVYKLLCFQDNIRWKKELVQRISKAISRGKLQSSDKMLKLADRVELIQAIAKPSPREDRNPDIEIPIVKWVIYDKPKLPIGESNTIGTPDSSEKLSGIKGCCRIVATCKYKLHGLVSVSIRYPDDLSTSDTLILREGQYSPLSKHSRRSLVWEISNPTYSRTVRSTSQSDIRRKLLHFQSCIGLGHSSDVKYFLQFCIRSIQNNVQYCRP